MKGPIIAVIGGASLDILHFRGQTARSAGGAGLYTALAAHRAGAQVTMFAPRPQPMPAVLRPAAERLRWMGPVVPPDDLPAFEIAHGGGGRTRLVQGRWGAEALLSPADLPPEGLPADLVHAVPLGSPARQLAFVRHFAARGCRTAAGTYCRAVADHPDVVRQIAQEVDIFFCNEWEARALFGPLEEVRVAPGKLLFVTRGAKGALVVQGAYRTSVPGVAVEELDPTGAGDTFCGSALALLEQGWHPVEAARQAAAAAAEMITAVGPAALLRPGPLPPAPSDPRARVDEEQVQRVAALVASLPDVVPFSFTGEDFPPPGHHRALDYFFASTLQQFGFWFDDGQAYQGPLVAPLGGQSLKGSDYLWRAYRLWLEEDPEGLTPARQARLTAQALSDRYRSDDRRNPMPAFEAHLELAQQYGKDMEALGWTPQQVVGRARSSETPLRAFLRHLDHMGGYKEDPLRKKAVLLALILRQRPEKFLPVEPSETVPPIIDYHLQRSCLRIGLVEVVDAALRRRLVARELLSSGEEEAIRRAAYAAIEGVQRESGQSMGAVDWFFFGARRRCPEMAEPDCARCPVDPVCAHRKELFQPVRRTTFY